MEENRLKRAISIAVETVKHYQGNCPFGSVFLGSVNKIVDPGFPSRPVQL